MQLLGLLLRNSAKVTIGRRILETMVCRIRISYIPLLVYKDWSK